MYRAIPSKPSRRRSLCLSSIGSSRRHVETLESRCLLAAVEYTQSFRPVDEYGIEWCTEATDVRFRLTLTGTGWAAIGFNDAQRMPFTDILMATGEGAVADTFADARAAPSVDDVQNVKLISFSQQDGTTIIELSRPINTGDLDGDYSLDTERFLLWAYNERRDSFTSQHTDRGFSAAKIKFNEAGACRPIGGELPKVSIANASLAEGNDGSQLFEFAVSLSSAVTSAVTVKYATANGSAVAGEDYTEQSGTVTFTPGGALTELVSISVNGDRTTESDEAFTVTLSEAQGATIENGVGTGTITNDDSIPTLLTNIQTLGETDADQERQLIVALTNPSSSEVTVNYSFVAKTANLNSDFRGTNGILVFPTGSVNQFIPFTLVGDDLEEAEELFEIVLSSPVNATISDGGNVIPLTIIDDDGTERPWQNSVLPEDVNGSNSVEPIDALLIINELNTVGSHPLTVPTGNGGPPPYLDVSGDNNVSPIDALLVINYLNRQAEQAAAAAVAAPKASMAADAVPIDLADLVWAQSGWNDDERIARKRLEDSSEV